MKLFRSWQQDRKQLVLLFFGQAFAALVIAYLFFSIPRLVAPNNVTAIAVGFVIAQALLYVAVAYFAKVTSFFIKSDITNRVFGYVIFFGMIAFFLSIVYFNEPFYDKVTGLTDWNIHPVVGWSSLIIFAGVLIPSIIIFAWQGFKTSNKVVRIRSLLIAVGLLFLTVTAYTYYNATSFEAAFTSDMLSLMSFLIIFFGVIYRRGLGQRNIDN